MPINENLQGSIPATLFRDNTLVIVRLSCWTGVTTVKRGDEEVFGSTSFDDRFFKRGGVIICDKERLRSFTNRQNALVNWMNNRGSSFFMIPGCRIFKNELMPEVAQRIADCKRDIDEICDVFLDLYPEEVERRIREFDDSHPESVGRLNKYFPSISDLRDKFGIKSMPIKISDVAEAEKIFQDESNTMRSHIQSFLSDIASEFRQKAVEAALSFKQGMDKASKSEGGSVHGKSVKAFQEFLSRIKSNDFLGDKKMTDMLDDMRDKVFAVKSWNVNGDEEAMEAIRSHLDEIVKMGEDEGETSAVIESYVIRSSGYEAQEVEEWDGASVTRMVSVPDSDPEIDDDEGDVVFVADKDLIEIQEE